MNRSNLNKSFALLPWGLAMAACLHAASLLADEVWRKPFAQAFTASSGNSEITSLAEFQGKLYLAAGGFGNPLAQGYVRPSGKVWRLVSKGCKQWEDVTPPWTSATPDYVTTTAVFQGHLYAGTEEARVWRTSDGQNWSDATANLAGAGRVCAMAEFNGHLYVAGFTVIYRTSDGNSWEPVVGPSPAAQPAGFGDPMANDISALAVFNGHLYAGLGRDNNNGISIWRTDDGKAWKPFHQIVPSGDALVGGLLPGHVHAMKAFGNHLYLGEYHGKNIYRSDGSLPPSSTHWETATSLPQGDVLRMAEHNGKLYVGRSTLGYVDQQPALYCSANGTEWSPVPGAPQNGPDCQRVASLLSYQGRLYVGTCNSSPSGTLVLWELGPEILPDKFDSTPTKNNTPQTATPLELTSFPAAPGLLLAEHSDLTFHDPDDVDFFAVTLQGVPDRMTILAREEYCGPIDVKLYDSKFASLPASGNIEIDGGQVRVADPSHLVQDGKLLIRLANPTPQTPIRYVLGVAVTYPQLAESHLPKAYRWPVWRDAPIRQTAPIDRLSLIAKSEQAEHPKVPGQADPSMLKPTGVQATPSQGPSLNTLTESAGAGTSVTAAAGQGRGKTDDRGLHGYVFALDPKGEKITGVVDGATIQLTDQAGSPVATVTSDKFGYYRANLAPGVYYYKVTAPGFKDEDCGRGVNAQLSTGFAIYPFSLTPGPNDPEHKPPEIPALKIGELAGTVWERTADGRVPLPAGVAATIKLRNMEGLLSGSGAAPATVTVVTGQADPDGRGGAYQVAMAAGAWQAAVSAPGFEPLVDPEAISIAADQTEPRDFELTRRTPVAPPPGQGIRGTVEIRGSDQASVLVPKVEVKIVSLATRARHSLAPDTAGGYSRDLPSGPYVVTAELPEFRTATSGRRNVLDGKYTTVDLVLVPLPKEKPQPRELAVTAIVLERADQPRPNLGVSLRPDVADAAEILEVMPGSAAAAGRLTAGDRIEAVGETPIRSTRDLIAQIQQAKVGQQLRLFFRRGDSRYQTTVTLGSQTPEGTPVAGATVTLLHAGQPPEGAPQGVTDANGQVVLKVPAEGAHRALAAKQGYVPGSNSLTVGAGEANQVVIHLSKQQPKTPLVLKVEKDLARLDVEVVEAGTLQPVPGLEVRLLRDGQVFRSDQTRSSNRCAWSEVPYGSYQVVAVGEPYTSRPKAVEVGQPQVACRLEVSKPEKPKPEPQRLVQLRVQVLGRENLPQGKPVSGAKVQVHLGDGRTSAQRVVAENAFPGTNREGIVTFNLPRGNYRVTVTAKDYREGASAADLTRANAWARVWLEPISAPGMSPGPTGQTVKTDTVGPKPPPPPQTTDLLVQVVGPQGESVRNAAVTLGLGNRGLKQGTSDLKGMVRFDPLPKDDLQYWLDAQSADRRMRGKAQVPVGWWLRDEVVKVVLQGTGPPPPPPPPPPPRTTELLVQLVGPQGESVRNAAVTLGLGNRGVRQGTSDLKGMVHFDGLPQNDWQYWLDAQSADRRMMGKAQVPVRWWTHGEVVKVVLQGTGPVRGTPGQPPATPSPNPLERTTELLVQVVGPRGESVGNAAVTLGLGNQGVQQGTSDLKGMVHFDRLPQNDWQYWLDAQSADRRMTGKAQVPVRWWARGQVVRVVLQGMGPGPGPIGPGVSGGPGPKVTATGTLQILVLGPHGQRMPNATVLLGLGTSPVRQEISAGDGIARFGPLEQNDWQYWVHAFTRDRSMEGRASVPVGWWGRGPVEVRLQGPGMPAGGIVGGMTPPGGTPQVGTLTVEVNRVVPPPSPVRGPVREPVLNAQVIVSGGPVGQRALQHVGNGQYRADLPAGQYQVAVTAPGYYPTTAPAGVAPQQNSVVRVDLRTSIQ